MVVKSQQNSHKNVKADPINRVNKHKFLWEERSESALDLLVVFLMDGTVNVCYLMSKSFILQTMYIKYTLLDMHECCKLLVLRNALYCQVAFHYVGFQMSDANF